MKCGCRDAAFDAIAKLTRLGSYLAVLCTVFLVGQTLTIGLRCKHNHNHNHTARRVWKNYFPAVDAIVFIVDGADRDRWNEAKIEIDVRLPCPPRPPALPALPLSAVRCPLSAVRCRALVVDIRLALPVLGHTSYKQHRSLSSMFHLALFPPCAVIAQPC